MGRPRRISDEQIIAAAFAWVYRGALHLKVFQASLRGGPAQPPELEAFLDLMLEGAAP